MNAEPVWLSRTEVERIHEKVVDASGGSQGLRDGQLLESAIARPRNLHSHGETDKFQLAASYAEGISRNHAFVDGNKRTAWTSAEVFLLKNGQYIQERQDDAHVTMMENLAQGNITREEAAAYLKENSRKLDQSSTERTSDMDAVKRTEQMIQGQNNTKGKIREHD